MESIEHDHQINDLGTIDQEAGAARRGGECAAGRKSLELCAVGERDADPIESPLGDPERPWSLEIAGEIAVAVGRQLRYRDRRPMRRGRMGWHNDRADTSLRPCAP